MNGNKNPIWSWNNSEGRADILCSTSILSLTLTQLFFPICSSTFSGKGLTLFRLICTLLGVKHFSHCSGDLKWRIEYKHTFHMCNQRQNHSKIPCVDRYSPLQVSFLCLQWCKNIIKRGLSILECICILVIATVADDITSGCICIKIWHCIITFFHECFYLKAVSGCSCIHSGIRHISLSRIPSLLLVCIKLQVSCFGRPPPLLTHLFATLTLNFFIVCFRVSFSGASISRSDTASSHSLLLLPSWHPS